MKCILCGAVDEIDERGSYPACHKCVSEQQECKERQQNGETLDRDVGVLCTQCGLCCVVLSAQVKPSEVESLANWSGKLPRDIARIEEAPYPCEGRIVLHRPCVFLLGKPTEYVRCRAYDTKRPAVCESYLCKLAIRYKAGLCTLNEALFVLRASVSAYGDLGMFNWSNDQSRDRADQNVAEIIAARRVLSFLNPEDNAALEVSFSLYEKLRKRYKFTSKEHEVLLSAMFTNFEGKSIELDHYLAPKQMVGWSERDKEIAKQVIYQVVSDFRSVFTVDKKSS